MKLSKILASALFAIVMAGGVLEATAANAQWGYYGGAQYRYYRHRRYRHYRPHYRRHHYYRTYYYRTW